MTSQSMYYECIDSKDQFKGRQLHQKDLLEAQEFLLGILDAGQVHDTSLDTIYAVLIKKFTL